MKKLFLNILVLFSGIIFAFCQDDFKIDWINGKIFSIAASKVKNDHDFAMNRLDAMDKIHEQAKANFVKVLKNINIYESVSVFSYFEQKSEKNRELFSFIDKAMLSNIEYPDLNTIKITYSIDIYGENSLMGILMDERGAFTENLTGYMDYNFDTGYTGVVIDARGELISYDGYKVKVKPCLFIVVKDSDGRIIFDKNYVYPETIKKSGMARYSYDINKVETDRVGKIPLKITASGTGDRAGSVIVITVSSAKKLLSSEITRKAIQDGKVVIIIDK